MSLAGADPVEADSAPGASPPASPLHLLIERAPLTLIQGQAVLLCACVTLLEGIDLNLIPLLAPSIARSWALPTSAFSIIFASGPIGLIVGGFGVGWFADRVGRRWSLIAAMALMALSTVATAFVVDVPQLLVCRVLTGIGFGGVIPAATSLVSEFLPSRLRASVVALVILGQSLGGLLAALLMKLPLGQLPWQAIILDVGGACILALALLLVLLPESPRYLLLRDPHGKRLERTLRRLRLAGRPAPSDGAAEARGRVRDLFTRQRALGTALLWATFIGVCATVSFFTSWLTLIYTAAGRPAAEGVSATAAYSAGGIVGGLAIPLFCLRWNVNAVLAATILAGAASSAALGTALGLGGNAHLVLAFVCGVFIPGAFFLLYPPVVRFYPTALRSTGVGAAVAFGRIGNTLSPAAAGMMLGLGATPTAVFWAMAAPMVLSCGALLLFSAATRGQASEA